MNLSIPEDELNVILGKAILDTLTPDTRDKIITTAIAQLNKLPEGRYGSDRRTPLQVAFENGVERLTNSLIEDVLKESEHYQRIKTEVAAMIAAFPAVESDPELKAKIVTLVLEHVQEAQRELERHRGY